jgi:hypothetical protein
VSSRFPVLYRSIAAIAVYPPISMPIPDAQLLCARTTTYLRFCLRPVVAH